MLAVEAAVAVVNYSGGGKKDRQSIKAKNPFSTHENICHLMLYTIVHTFFSWSTLYTSYLGFFSH